MRIIDIAIELLRRTMVTVPSVPSQKLLAEQRLILHNISWNAYETILEALDEHRSAHLTYDRGRLEIMVPLEPHESASDLIGLFIRILAEELDVNLKSLRSTTLKRADLERSPEADNCYYIQNEPLVRGKIVDLNFDPPPDLVVEVEITHSDIDKLDLYARIGILEFWRYDGRCLQIYELREGKYRETETSPAFPHTWLTPKTLSDFISQCQKQGETQSSKAFRKWVQQQERTRSR